MPRPRRDSEILPAKERLENAFWELLSEREYRKITVTDICNTADLNRSTFYAHYEDAAQVLREIESDVMQQLPVDSDFLTEGNGEPEDLDTRMEDHVADESRYLCMARPIPPRRVETALPVQDDPLNMLVRR